MLPTGILLCQSFLIGHFLEVNGILFLVWHIFQIWNIFQQTIFWDMQNVEQNLFPKFPAFLWLETLMKLLSLMCVRCFHKKSSFRECKTQLYSETNLYYCKHLKVIKKMLESIIVSKNNCWRTRRTTVQFHQKQFQGNVEELHILRTTVQILHNIATCHGCMAVFFSVRFCTFLQHIT